MRRDRALPVWSLVAAGMIVAVGPALADTPGPIDLCGSGAEAKVAPGQRLAVQAPEAAPRDERAWLTSASRPGQWVPGRSGYRWAGEDWFPVAPGDPAAGGRYVWRSGAWRWDGGR